MEHATSPSCAACGATLNEEFCGSCGERKFDHHALSLGHFAEHAFEAFSHFDTAILRTLKALVMAPGRLTADWARGCRKPYLPPVQFFLVMNLLFFVTQSLNHWNTLTTNLDVHLTGTTHKEMARSMVKEKLADRGVQYKEYRPVFDAKATIQAKSMVILMVPVFALAVAILSFGLRRYAVEHLVFSLHFYSFYLLYLSVTSSAATVVLQALKMAGMAPSDTAIDQVVSSLMLLVLGAYLAIAIRVVYQNRWWVSVLKAGVLVWASLEILYLYRFVLFLVTFRST
jgi:hypothetical protein